MINFLNRMTEFPVLRVRTVCMCILCRVLHIQQEVVGRTNRLPSIHYIFSIWYAKDRIENTALNSSSIVCTFVPNGTCFPSRCLAMAVSSRSTIDRETHIHLFLVYAYKEKSNSIITFLEFAVTKSRDSVIGIAIGYGLDDWRVGVRVPVGSRMFSSPCRPHWLWSPLSLLSNGYRRLFPRRLSGRDVKLTTHLQIVPKSKKCGSIHPSYAFMAWCSIS
jgi:hypothetical protein